MERKIQLLLFLAFTTVVSGKLEAVYESPNDHNKLFDIGRELVFQCKPNAGVDGKDIVWTKDGTDVKQVGQLRDNYEINSKDGKLVIRRAHEEDAGNYTCSLDKESYTFDAWARVLVKIPTNSYVVENEKLEINCIAKGTNPKIEWKHAKNVTSEPSENDYADLDEDDHRYAFEDHDKIPNSRLIINDAKLTDYAYYKCVGTNAVMEARGDAPAESEGLVRVKDKLAALWPFLGICAEVFILCTIILIYEKRRNKTDLDESDTDQSPDQKNRK